MKPIRQSCPAVVACAIAGSLFAETAWAREMSFDERVSAQRSIEEVYRRHRMGHGATLPESALRAKVETYLKESNALERFWRRPISGQQLQAELDRIAASTKAPAMLRELFAVLGNDPFVIAETLARQTLAERLARGWYSADDGKTFSTWWEETAPLLATSPSASGGGFLLPVIAIASSTPDSWRPIPAGAPDPAADPTAVWTGTEMIVFGSTGGARYLPATDTWFLTSNATAPVPRSYHTAVWTGAMMIVWGGADSTGNPLMSGGRYDPATDTWAPTSTSGGVPAGREYHTAIWTGSRMIVWGGLTAAGITLNSGALYDPASDSWSATSASGQAPEARWLHTAVWTGSRMVIWGGQTAPAGSMLNTGSLYDPVMDKWNDTSTASGVPSPRGSHSAVWTGTRMIVWGGASDSLGSVVNTGGRYDPATNSWVATSGGTGVPTPRQQHTAVWASTEMIVWGGLLPGTTVKTGARYNPSTDSWVPTSIGSGTPTQRSNHAAVWTGAEMITWGGNGLNTGGRYAPSTDTWVPTSTGQPSPTARTQHTAVWTGAEMIVWGGVGSAEDLNTGGRYDPATASWTETSTAAGVPAPRRAHTAVWSGTEMIVWGGINSVQAQLATGGRYDPATDSWVPTSNAGAPARRTGHAAVWTGTEMIVWGGTGGPQAYFADGARYLPSTDTWTSMSQAGLEGRTDPAAVWTGTEMIVWGGTAVPPMQTQQFYNTGGRFEPATNGWVATSTGVNVPAGRAQHAAVWTGTELIVWGGYSSAVGDMNTGGRYNPATNSWTPTSTGANTPSGRKHHTATWTGSEMVVWGGSVSATDFSENTGARYDPAADGWVPTTTSSAPNGRGQHTALSAGDEVIVWGGSPTTATGGLYCGSGRMYYRDLDADGYGTGDTTTSACGRPAGWAVSSGDCDDADPSIHPEAAEVCNGLDDDCDLAVDDGISAPSESPVGRVERVSDDTVALSWLAVPAATAYDVLWGDLTSLRTANGGGDFVAATSGCVVDDLAATSVLFTPPSPAAWFLVRPVNCAGAGTYATGASAEEPGRDTEIAASGHACP